MKKCVLKLVPSYEEESTGSTDQLCGGSHRVHLKPECMGPGCSDISINEFFELIGITELEHGESSEYLFG